MPKLITNDTRFGFQDGSSNTTRLPQDSYSQPRPGHHPALEVSTISLDESMAPPPVSGRSCPRPQHVPTPTTYQESHICPTPPAMLLWASQASSTVNRHGLTKLPIPSFSQDWQDHEPSGPFISITQRGRQSLAPATPHHPLGLPRSKAQHAPGHLAHRHQDRAAGRGNVYYKVEK